MDSNLILKVAYIYVVYLAVILIWQFGESHKLGNC